MEIKEVSSGVTVKIDLSDIVRSCTREQLTDILQSLACTDEIIRHVIDQVMTGYTENGSHGAQSIPDECFDNGFGYGNALDEARKQLVKIANTTAATRVARLESFLKMAFQSRCKMRDECYKLRAQLRSAEASITFKGQMVDEFRRDVIFWKARAQEVRIPPITIMTGPDL